jgi:hypothetical protein
MSQRRQPLRSFARRAISGTTSRRAFAQSKRDLAVWADIRAFPPLAVIAALDCVAGLVLWRRFAGGAPLHLTTARFCIAGIAISALVVAGRWWLARIERELPALWLRCLLMAFGAAPMIVLLSIANAQHSPWAVSLISALAVVSGGAALLWNRLSIPQSPSAEHAAVRPASIPFPASTPDPSSASAALVRPDTSNAPSVGTAHPARQESIAPKAHEWMERTLDALGAVSLRGQVQAEFAAGQSTTVVHIPFCPPFALLPEVTCEIIDAPTVRTREPAVFRYGARVELKRAGDVSASVCVTVGFRASVAANAARAA